MTRAGESARKLRDHGALELERRGAAEQELERHKWIFFRAHPYGEGFNLGKRRLGESAQQLFVVSEVPCSAWAPVYRHFADHKALLGALAEAPLSEIEALTIRVRAEKDPLLALELLLRGTTALDLKSPVIAQLLASPQRESRELRGSSPIGNCRRADPSRGRKAKVIRSDLKAETFIVSFWA